MSAEAQQARELITDAGSILVLTGAGMSQESGVPTFRDAQTGLWARYDPMELATEDAFRCYPERVFGWYLWRYRLVSRAEPNAGHKALARLQGGLVHGEQTAFTVITQNVDGLHQRAGNKAVIELHGSLSRFRCLDRGHPFDPSGLADLATPEHGEVTPPPCDVCGSPVRPDVVWFGEVLPQEALEAAYACARSCDLVLVVGTSGVVYPAAGLPEVGLQRGIPVIEISPQPTSFTPHVTLSWASTAAIALPQLVTALRVP
jgi:NAD-dependent deacetylase